MVLALCLGQAKVKALKCQCRLRPASASARLNSSAFLVIKGSLGRRPAIASAKLKTRAFLVVRDRLVACCGTVYSSPKPRFYRLWKGSMEGMSNFSRRA
jgi:hypothetical protein